MQQEGVWNIKGIPRYAYTLYHFAHVRLNSENTTGLQALKTAWYYNIQKKKKRRQLNW